MARHALTKRATCTKPCSSGAAADLWQTLAMTGDFEALVMDSACSSHRLGSSTAFRVRPALARGQTGVSTQGATSSPADRSPCYDRASVPGSPPGLDIPVRLSRASSTVDRAVHTGPGLSMSPNPMGSLYHAALALRTSREFIIIAPWAFTATLRRGCGVLCGHGSCVCCMSPRQYGKNQGCLRRFILRIPARPRAAPRMRHTECFAMAVQFRPGIRQDKAQKVYANGALDGRIPAMSRFGSG
ncbi:hypothetical protein B0H21DRAFT_568696 [Amylocystis lapponica]|nr:hypothetical protein B0H21DRAFT_568696 [Amylocystis lapponica]